MGTNQLGDENAKLLDKVILGDWSISDLIEATVDETSVAANAGSGTDHKLGQTTSFQDEKLEKILDEFEGYLRKSKDLKVKSLKAKDYAERRGLPGSWAKRLSEHVGKGKK